ncbi:MAG: PEP-utilizing enzyme [Alphaproteobacteria bacterium]|nr:PEP-utilizing enzyme [Alphaproteobacteria bacterium]
MQTLWLAFPEESISQRQFGLPAQRRLEDIFSLADTASPWRRAMGLLRMPAPAAETQMIAWKGGVPYVNGSALGYIASGGIVVAVPDKAQGFRFSAPRAILKLPQAMALQWRVTRFIQERLADRAAPDADDITESLALGLALQTLLMRLDAKTAARLPQYLAAPDTAPALHRKTFVWIQALQMRRTALSPAWHRLFADAQAADKPRKPPPFYWGDQAPAAPPAGPAPVAQTNIFKGQPVCAGRVEAAAEIVTRLADTPPPRADKPVYVFRYARPETTVYFPQAGALVFAQGGVLSHACVVARDMGIPCVTGVGEEFFTRMSTAGAGLRLAVDGSNGEVKIISC